ncbi:MAG: dynamin family protein, partial [Myxococcota bacterium]
MTPLQSYRELTFRMAGDLVAAADIARRRGRPELAAEADELRRRIEARRFTLAVVGEFKRGKSTLVNALLGAAVLPADVLPASAALNRVTFGLAPGATLWFHDGRPPEVVPIASLADHVTKLTPESAARAATVREAVITHPLALCRNDVDLVDTPGLADEPAMTDVTVGVLPSIDAAIVVTMADAPFSDGEAALVRRLRERGIDNLLFVVTAIDRIRREPDRERVLASVRARVAAAGVESPAVWGLSGQDALDGRIEGDADRVRTSGLPEFEAALEQFLTKSDGVALARRAAQLAALCSSLLATDGPDVVLADPRAPLHALIDATDRGLERQVRRWEAAGNAAWDAVRADLESLPKEVGQVAGAIVARHRNKVVPGWQERRDALMGELVSEVDAAVRDRIVAALAGAGPAIGRVAADEQPELDRAWT